MMGRPGRLGRSSLSTSSSIEEAFGRVIESCRTLDMHAATTLRPPVPEARVVDTFGHAFDREPPEHLLQWFALHDGQHESRPGWGPWPITHRWVLVSLDEAAKQHEDWVRDWANEAIEDMEIVWRSAVPVLRSDNYWICASVDADTTIVEVPHGDEATVHACDLIDVCDTIADMNLGGITVVETVDPPAQHLTVNSEQIDDELRSRPSFQLLYGGH